MASPIPIICPYCGVGCNLDLELGENGRPVRSRATGRNPELNSRYACVKGFTVHELICHKDRLTHPLVHTAGKKKAVSWKEAIGFASRRLKEIAQKHGSESIGMLCSGKILNEEVYLSQKFQRAVIGNNHVDNCARLCHGPSEAALRNQLGYGAVSTFLEDYETTHTVFLVGAHTTYTRSHLDAG